MKSFVDSKINVTKKKSDFNRVENMGGKGEQVILVTSISPFSTMFFDSFFPKGHSKSAFYGKGLAGISISRSGFIFGTF